MEHTVSPGGAEVADLSVLNGRASLGSAAVKTHRNVTEASTTVALTNTNCH